MRCRRHQLCYTATMKAQTPSYLPLDQRFRGVLIDLGIFAAATLGTYAAQAFDRPRTSVLLYIIGVILVGARSGLRNGILAALGASFMFNFFISEPTFRFGVSSADEIVPLIVFNLSAIITGGLAGRLKDSARAARSAESKNAFLLKISDSLQKAIKVADVAEIARQALPLQGLTDLEIYISKNGSLYWPEENDQTVDALDALLPKETEQQSNSSFRVYELTGTYGDIGVVKFLFRERSMVDRELPDLQALANLLALAVDRCLLLEKLTETRAVQRSEKLKSAILSSVSHDLRTPLTAIEVAASSLRSGALNLSPEQKEEMLSNIEEQCRKLNRYTANLLDMGRIQAGISPTMFEDVDVTDILGVVLSNIRHSFPGQSVEKEIRLKAPIVRANAAMLEQVIFNVIENAIVHGGGGEAIQVRLHAKDGNCVLEITDRGPGISKADQPHIFKRFYRTDQPKNRRGSGLGLYIAKGFVQAFGGTMMVVSPTSKNIGTTVAIRLPLAENAHEVEVPA